MCAQNLPKWLGNGFKGYARWLWHLTPGAKFAMLVINIIVIVTLVGKLGLSQLAGHQFEQLAVIGAVLFFAGSMLFGSSRR